MVNYMYRAMQNPDTPNLPFAQTMYRDMQNDDTPSLPFAQGRPSKFVYYNYTVNGDHWTFGKMENKKVRWTEDNAQKYRNYGYSVVRESDTPTDALGREVETETPTTTTNGNGNGYSKSYIKEHLDRLYKIHEEQEGRITSGYEHRKSIESKVDTNISKFSGIHSSLSDLGKSVTDVSTGLEAHKLGHNGFNPFGDIPMWLAIGGIALFMVIKR